MVYNGLSLSLVDSISIYWRVTGTRRNTKQKNIRHLQLYTIYNITNELLKKRMSKKTGKSGVNNSVTEYCTYLHTYSTVLRQLVRNRK